MTLFLSMLCFPFSRYQLTDGDKNFLPYERTLFDALFEGRDSVRLSELKYTFATDLGKVRKQLYADMVSQGWYRQSPATTRTGAGTHRPPDVHSGRCSP